MNSFLKLISVFTLLLSVMFMTSVTYADSFFDVFFDVTYDSDANRPILNLTVRGEKSSDDEMNRFDTEMIAMSLTSSSPRGDNRGVLYNASVEYLILNIGSSGEDGVKTNETAYAKLKFMCKKDKCKVLSTRALSRDEYHGHVTVLK